MRFSLGFLSFCLLACAAACNPVNPTRISHGGAPGRLLEGDQEVAVSATGVYVIESALAGGEFDYSHAVSDTLAIETGGYYAVLPIGEVVHMTMGSVGLAVLPEPRSGRFAVGFELGAAAGFQYFSNNAQYFSNDTPPPVSTQVWFAAGGYAGVGFGWHFRRSSVFLKTRAEFVSLFGDMEMAAIVSSVFGFERYLSETVGLRMAFGGAMYVPQGESPLFFPGLELGLTVRI